MASKLPCPACANPAYCIVQNACFDEGGKTAMTEAIERVRDAGEAGSDALMRLQIQYDAGRGTPAQRKEAREILGLI